jgi:hypothetical protein
VFASTPVTLGGWSGVGSRPRVIHENEDCKETSAFPMRSVHAQISCVHTSSSFAQTQKYGYNNCLSRDTDGSLLPTVKCPCSPSVLVESVSVVGLIPLTRAPRPSIFANLLDILNDRAGIMSMRNVVGVCPLSRDSIACEMSLELRTQLLIP